MNEKVLIFYDEKDLSPVGGAGGFLFNMKTVIDKRGINKIEFIRNTNNLSSSELKNITISIKKVLKRFIGRKITRYIINYRLIDSIDNEKEASKFNLVNYGIVHFHSTYQLYMNRNNLSNFNGKVILTSHSPKPLHLEIREDVLSKCERIIYKKKLQEIKKFDSYAFTRADYIIFPCKYAEEPYYKNWSEYGKIKQSKDERYKYVLTGCNKCISKRSKEDIREANKIPINAFVICYVGRHNKTKGYDILKSIGKDVLLRYREVYFLIAGKEEPLKGLKEERWVEIGWTNDPHSIIAASDLFILPNKETYFDLIMLEVLSLGRMVLASYTGGNKYFKKFKESGIFYFNSKEQAIGEIEKIIRFEESQKKYFESLNYEIYEQNFTTEKFMDSYLTAINEISES